MAWSLTKDEFDDIRYGDYVSPWVSRTFYGGQVTEEQKQNWKQTFSTMYSDPAESQLCRLRHVIQQKRMREKFDGMVRAGLAANSLEGKREFLRNEEKVDFRYVLKRYTSIPDDDVEVTDAGRQCPFTATTRVMPNMPSVLAATSNTSAFR